MMNMLFSLPPTKNTHIKNTQNNNLARCFIQARHLVSKIERTAQLRDIGTVC